MACFCGGSAANQVVPDPIPDFDDTRLYLGQHGYTRRIRNAKGLDLYAYFWPCDPSVPLKGVVQLAHGNATYICFDYLKFVAQGKPNIYAGSWVEAMNKAGFAVAGIDHQGFGRSKGVRSYVDRFQDHVDNLMLLSDHLATNERAAYPVDRLPHFLVAHSMGGLAATLACVQRPGRYAGLVLIAPMLSLAHRLKETGNLRYALKVLAAVAPKLEVGDSSTVRHVPWIYDAWDADPYVYDGRMRARNVEEFFKATERLNYAPGLGEEQEEEVAAGGGGAPGGKEGLEKGADGAEGGGEEGNGPGKKRKKGRRRTAKVAPGPDGSPPDLGMMSRVGVPLLIFQSERDTHVEPDGARRLIARASTHDKTLRMLTKQWHVLSKEEGWEELCLETVEWLAARADGRGPAAPPPEAMGGSGGYSTGQQQPPSTYMPQPYQQQSPPQPAGVEAAEPHAPPMPASSYHHQPQPSAASASGPASGQSESYTGSGGNEAAPHHAGYGGTAATGPMGEPLGPGQHPRYSNERLGADGGESRPGSAAAAPAAPAARGSRDAGAAEEGASGRPSGLPPRPGSGTGPGSGGGAALPLPPMPAGGGNRSIGGLAPLAPIQQRRSLGQPPPELASAPGGAAAVYTGSSAAAAPGSAASSLPPLRPMTARSRLPPI
ncbi:hypothetical protein HYH02_002503 [Chlamydomonas schloesseri]|uniref:Serine aminopeptidase S33 domain-containing protein n=1 Tax=Chlamydomonas schloesseri TaxID=2026947 RepID=A0A835WS54_9CHLO|nr:hypothetical protein HYH02_002503 [Chlamydomonas schloesseri]|eukprot:KAG2453179.1 hypothetical protein HYH02_002503 [Chlamydomonas schloesseri]